MHGDLVEAESLIQNYTGCVCSSARLSALLFNISPLQGSRSGDRRPIASLQSPRPEVQAGQCHPDKTDKFAFAPGERL